MCKEALCINSNHLAVSFDQSVEQKIKNTQKWLFRIEESYADSLLKKYIASEVQISFIRCRHV